MPKSNSLKELGYKIEASQDAKFPFTATSKRGTPYVFEQTPKGLRAHRTKETKDTTTVSNLYSFTATGEGDSLDLVGEVFKSERKRGTPADSKEPVAEAGAEPAKVETAA